MISPLKKALSLRLEKTARR